MPRFLQITYSLIIIALLVVTPFAYLAYVKSHYRNFRVVEERVLYRSGQLNTAGLERLIHDRGIRTIVSMRDGEKDLDKDEEEYCAMVGVKFVRLPPLNWGRTKDGVPADSNVKAFIDVMKEKSNYPVLVHCWAGIHRTGQMCAVYRMEFQGWTNEQAIAEMKGLGYTVEHQDVMDYMANYQRRRPEFALTGRSHDDSSQKIVAP